MNSPRWMRVCQGSVAAAFALLACSLTRTHTAHAEIPIAKANNWELTLDGRINTFLSVSRGDRQPKGTALWQGIEDKPDADGNIGMSRIRSGFVQNVLGWTLKKQLMPDLLVTGRFATWVGVSQTRSKLDFPTLDAREVYLKLEGPWGAFMAGRALSLFGRGGIMLDYEIEHQFGLGHPCMVRTVQGGACGHAGHGILFPAFNASIGYITPSFGGLQVAVGMYDPSAVQERSYERTPFPRFEGEISFKVPQYFHAEVSAMWQRIGHNENLELNVDAAGLSYSAGATLGPVQLGAAGFLGQGLGIYMAMENYPIFTDEKFVLRHQSGFLGLGAINIGHTKIAGGAGVTQIKTTENDPKGPFPALNFPKQQLGISAGVYQNVMDTVVFAAEYFRATYTFNEAVDPNDPMSMKSVTPKQNVNFFNVGATLIF